ncbi:MAG: restriction endonuclease subunit S, partial [Verrucomicrobiales bacterium]|nr:restriction endonuclease subunit S [Verrucomicrobiales bacterium]
MSEKWCQTSLGEICDKIDGVIKTGPFGSQLHESDYTEEGTPVVMPKNIIEGKVSTKSIARISTIDIERLSQHKLKPGDIVYGRRGDIGRQALVTLRENGWLCGTGCLRLSLGDEIVDPKFLHYYLRDKKVIRYISNQAVGATMPNLNTTILRNIPVCYPPLPEQKRIAGILSAYDDLIENNLRRIKILEEMAQSLYREWFVHFRFPCCAPSPLTPLPEGEVDKNLVASESSSPQTTLPDDERRKNLEVSNSSSPSGRGGGEGRVKLVDSPLGKIPVGWEVVAMPDAVEIRPKLPVP